MIMLMGLYSIIGVQIFREQFPGYFGNLSKSMYTLFQIMTLESWSEGISRPVMAKYPLAWLYFMSYVIFTTFLILNIFTAVFLESMQAVSEEDTVEDFVNQMEQEAEMEQENDRAPVGDPSSPSNSKMGKVVSIKPVATSDDVDTPTGDTAGDRRITVESLDDVSNSIAFDSLQTNLDDMRQRMDEMQRVLRQLRNNQEVL